MAALRPVLPERYSPLQANGNGIQSVYLTELPSDFAEVLAGLIGAEVTSLIAVSACFQAQPERLFCSLTAFTANLSVRGTWYAKYTSGS